MANIINSTDFDNLMAKKGTALVDFYADWCGPCKMMAPVVDALAEKMKGKADVVKVNVDKESALANKFGVISIPCFVFFKNGEKVDTLIGGQPDNKLEETLNKYL